MTKVLDNSLALAFILLIVIDVTVCVPFGAKPVGDVPMLAKFAGNDGGFQFAGVTGTPPTPPPGMRGSPPPPPPGWTGGPPPSGPPPSTTTASSG